MNKLLIGCATLPLLIGAAMAGTPKSLSDIQMDKVTAGGTIIIPAGAISINNPSITVTITNIANPNPPPPTITVTISSPGISYSSPEYVITVPTITISGGP